MLAQNKNNEGYFLTRFDDQDNQVGSSMMLSDCFRKLEPKKIKNHPKHGIVILGTDRWGYSYRESHTVYFNVTDDFQYTCPE